MRITISIRTIRKKRIEITRRRNVSKGTTNNVLLYVTSTPKNRNINTVSSGGFESVVVILQGFYCTYMLKNPITI